MSQSIIWVGRARAPADVGQKTGGEKKSHRGGKMPRIQAAFTGSYHRHRLRRTTENPHRSSRYALLNKLRRVGKNPRYQVAAVPLKPYTIHNYLRKKLLRVEGGLTVGYVRLRTIGYR